MADYRFLTTWCLDAPIERVWEVINDSARTPSGGRASRRSSSSGTATRRGVGQVSRFSWRSVLPYTLRFDMRVTAVERPHLIEGEATGELEGQGVWRLYDGPGTAVVYDWRVRTTQPWMNLLGPVARPAFAWNHDLVMRQGGFGLARRLGATLVAHD